MEMEITPQEHDVALILRDHPTWNHAIYFIRGLQSGGGRGGADAFRALSAEAERITGLFAVPAIYQSMIAHPRWDDTDLSSWRVASSARATAISTSSSR